jgi:hypothetical protein
MDEGRGEFPAARNDRGGILRTGRFATWRWPLGITAAIIATSLFPLPALVDITQPGAFLRASLRTSFAYDLMAPVSNVFDALTLLSPAQFCATLITGAVVFALIALRTPRNAAAWLRAGVRYFGGAIAVTGLLLVAARPMASISVGDPDLIAIDFHSHTSASHDGRAGFDAEHNRAWHRSAGYDAVYVTDHRTFDGAVEGSKDNPSVAGRGTVLLPGVELRDTGEHPILIGVDPRRMRIGSPDWKDAAVAADGGPAPPMMFLALPGNLRRIPLNMTTSVVRLAGIEISDGSPRGLAQSATDRVAIRSLAAKLDVALISASDNHGWGRAAPAWSVMRIPGWRAMTPASLDIAIRNTIAGRRRRSVEVIARQTAAEPVSALGFATTGIAVALVMLRTMSLPERGSWLAWTWLLFLLHQRLARANRLRFHLRARRVARRTRPVKAAA